MEKARSNPKGKKWGNNIKIIVVRGDVVKSTRSYPFHVKEIVSIGKVCQHNVSTFNKDDIIIFKLAAFSKLTLDHIRFLWSRLI